MVRGAADLARGVAGLVLVLVAWEAVAESGAVSRAFLPTVPGTVEALRRGLATGTLVQALALTTVRMVAGWLMAGLTGIAIGVLIGLSHTARSYILPLLEFLRPLPAPAIVPLSIALLGLGPTMVLVVIVFGSVWPPMLATVSGLSLLEPRLVEVSQMLGLTKVQFILKIGLPSAVPDIVASLRVSLGLALILAVLGEMLAGQPGLGQAILLAARSFRAVDLFAAIILLSCLGVCANLLLGRAERRLAAWSTLRRQ